MGSRGYALLIEHGIETARKFAAEIKNRLDFQIVTPPELNILTYRVFPAELQKQMLSADIEKQIRINEKLNEINRTVQRLQREAGKSFVSRTTLKMKNRLEQDKVVLRAVIMNPMTTIDILRKILDEQEKIYKTAFN
jgi:glutamate decarboxylase